MSNAASAPLVLVAAGLEPLGRAGLLADVWAIQKRKARAAAVATAITAQSSRLFALEPVSAAVVGKQVRAVCELEPVAAVKLGLVPDARVLRILRAALAEVQVPWVVDPVVLSSQGKPLSELKPRDYLALASERVVLTPNAIEAGWLLGRPPPQDAEEAQAAAIALLALGFGAVLLKGGHLRDTPADIVASAASRTVSILRSSRLARTRAHRGTGCRYGSTVAAELAMGADLLSAAREAKKVVRKFIAILRPTSGSADPGA